MLKLFEVGKASGQWSSIDEFYWANHHVSQLINCGVTAGDAAYAFEAAIKLAKSGLSANSDEFKRAVYDGMVGTAEWLARSAEQDIRDGHPLTAADKRLRATAFFELADWYFWPWSSPTKDPELVGNLFFKGRSLFREAVTKLNEQAVWVHVPFEGKLLDGLFVQANTGDQSGPVVIHLNGMHSSLQWHYLSGLPQLLAQRGVSSLLYDHPGVGSARYSSGLPVRADTESYVGAAIDWLLSREAFKVSGIGLVGGSFGGYRASRAGSIDRRVDAVALWGAYSAFNSAAYTYWPSIIRKLIDGDPFSPDEEETIDELFFWTGLQDREELANTFKEIDIQAWIAKMTAPLLIVHGANDVQVLPEEAIRTAKAAVNARKVDLILSNDPIGGQQHVNWDNPRNSLCQIADWLSDELALKNRS